jgi:hypoxanthine phosphoribosyltransferase
MNSSYYLDWQNIITCLKDKRAEIISYDPQVIIGVLRGGGIVAILLHYLLESHGRNKVELMMYPIKYPLKYSYNMDKARRILELQDEVCIQKAVSRKRVLIVDDGAFSGSTAKSLKEKLLNLGANEVKCFIISVNKNTDEEPDWYCVESNSLVRFPWKEHLDQLYKIETENKPLPKICFKLVIDKNLFSDETRRKVVNHIVDYFRKDGKECVSVCSKNESLDYSDDTPFAVVDFPEENVIEVKLVSLGWIDEIPGACKLIKFCSECEENRQTELCYLCHHLNISLFKANKILKILKEPVKHDLTIIDCDVACNYPNLADVFKELKPKLLNLFRSSTQ